MVSPSTYVPAAVQVATGLLTVGLEKVIAGPLISNHE